MGMKLAEANVASQINTYADIQVLYGKWKL
jgi:hypothetical protein